MSAGRRAAATLAALLVVWPAWWLGGVVMEFLSLGALDLLGRLCLVFLALGLAEALFARLGPAEGGSHG